MLQALDNRDPFTAQNVLSRGVVGTRGDTPTVASPLPTQVVDLASGVGVSDATRSVAVHDVRVVHGVQVRSPARSGS